MSEGKVYLGERAATAAENFFREGNLTALREMALRLTAERVDRRLRANWVPREPRAKAWRTGDRLLVGVSASPHSAELVRWTRRYAGSLEAPWIAVAVELPKPLGPNDEKRRAENLALARQLGAEVVLASGVHVGEALLESSRGNTARRRSFSANLRARRGDGFSDSRSPVGWLIRQSGSIDIQLVRT